MPDSSAPALAASAYVFPDGVLNDLLAVSLTALNVMRPLYGPDGTELVDFAVEYLNPAAQRITGLPERPNVTARGRFPDVFTNGVFDFYRRVFETGEPGRYDFNYQADGFDNYFHVAARRSGELLVVSFTDTADHARTPVEEALRASQAREQQALAQVEAQRAHLQQVLLHLPAQIATYRGPDYVYDFVNARYTQPLPRRTYLGRPIREVLPEVAAQGILAAFDQVYRTGEPHHLPEQELWLDLQGTGQPEQLYLDFYLHPLRDAEGHIYGLLDFTYNVTAQVRARQQVETLNQELETRVAERTVALQAAVQDQLQEREKFYQIFAHTPAAICIQRGPEHRYEYVNAAYQQFFPDRQLLGRPVAEALPEIVPAGILALLDGVYQTGGTYFGHEVPLLMARPGGRPPQQRYFTFTYQAYRENGEIVGISTFAYDVSEQVIARQQQQQHLHELFEQAPVAVAVFRGPRYVIEMANPAVCAMWGRTMAQTVGTPLFELLPEAAGQGFEELLDGVMATGVPYVAHELPAVIHRDGQRENVYWNFVYQPLREAAGDPITAVTVVATDVTEQVHARERVQELNQELATTNEELQVSIEELRETNEQLTRTNVDLDNFIYTASHDLKLPIANIEGLLNALREQLPAEALQEPLVPRMLAMMQESVERFQLTIHQLTNLTRLQQVHDVRPEAVDLAAAVDAVCQDLAGQLTGAQLQVDIPPGFCVHFSPQNLRSVVYNLLTNALKFRHPDRPPRVHLRAYQADFTAVLQVQDNGLGLNEQQQAQLFGLFKRLHTHVDGTGIGLYTVKRLVENAGGTIAVQSQAGVGSTFTVTFPA